MILQTQIVVIIGKQKHCLHIIKTIYVSNV